MKTKMKTKIKAKMESVRIIAEPCECKGKCEKGILHKKECVHWLAREYQMVTYWCKVCDAYTWHANGECLRCKLTGGEESRDKSSRGKLRRHKSTNNKGEPHDGR